MNRTIKGIIVIIVSIILATAPQVLAVVPPFTGANQYHNDFEVNPWGVYKHANSDSSINLSTGDIWHNSWVDSMYVSGIGIGVIDAIYSDFTVPTSGYYSIKYNGDLSGGFWNVSASFVLGAAKGAGDLWIESQITQIPESKFKKYLHETDLSVGAEISQMTWSSIKTYLGIGSFVNALSVIKSQHIPEKYWDPSTDKFSMTSYVYLEAGQTYRWAFSVNSSTASASLGAAYNVATFDLDVRLKEVRITPINPQENNNPFLYNGGVSPQSGTTVTNFEYTVNYLDTDGDVPDYVRVYIDGSPHDMTLWNGTAANGQYHYVTQLSSGGHNYYFTATDIRGGYQQTVSYTGPDVDVPPSGSFVILDRLVTDSFEFASYNDQDGVIESGEVIGIRPRIKLDASALVAATNIYMTLSSDNPSLEVWSGDRRYPDMSPSNITYPQNGAYIQVIINKNCQGIYYLDADLKWKEDGISRQQHFTNAIELNIQPAPWLNLTNEEWDFGVVKPGNIVSYSLIVRNIGTGVLQVTGINSLGDTTATPSSFPLNAGASQNVEVSINTSGIPSGTRITRDVHVISNGRSDDPSQDEHLIITGLVSNTLPIYKIPTTVNQPAYPDISGNWIVWHEDRNGDGTWDILAYNVSTGEEVAIPSSQYHQGNPYISGNLITWRDSRNWNGSGDWTKQSDVYGYDLSTRQEFAICNGPGKDYVVGVSGNLIAVSSWYETIFDQGGWSEDAYNLLVFQYLGNGQCTQIYSTGYTPKTGTQTRPTFYSGDSDFGDGMLAFELGEIYWDAEYGYWDSGRRKTYKIDFASGESTPGMISTVGSGPSDYSAAIHKFVYIDEDSEGDDVVWLWPGNTQITPSLGIDYGDGWTAFNGTRIVYSKYPDPYLFYWDLSTSQEELVTNQLLGVQDARLDGNGLVWEGMGTDSQWYVYFTYFNLSDVSVSSSNITFSNSTPIEGAFIDISVLVRNTTDYHCTNNIIVKLFDGDPDIAGTQLGTDYTIVGGISANGESLATFTNIPVGLEGTHEIFARLQVSGMDIYLNNKASKELVVGDTDTQGPVISNVNVQEFNGDGDGRIEDNEQIFISWQATDSSGINSSSCTINSNNFSALGTYFVIVGPCALGNYDFTISATDGDSSAETSEYLGEFTIAGIPGDFEPDGDVDFSDLEVLAEQWLQLPGTPSADIAPQPNGDGIIDFLDFALFAKHWLISNELQIPDNIVWVSINDPGVSGHEGFNGYMGKYEITNAQYCQFLNAALASGDITIDANNVIGANGSNSGADFVGQLYYSLTGQGYTDDGATNGGAAWIHYTGSSFTIDNGFENHPVTWVSWYGATAFCNYYGYRLPTEWEWQAVADYNGSYSYGCGTTLDNNLANYHGSTHPFGTTFVGAFGTYGYGVSDMAGNANEWTSSIYGGYNPEYHVLRGGGWNDYGDANTCAVSFRHGAPFPSGHIGFRVCRNVEPVGMVWVSINDPDRT